MTRRPSIVAGLCLAAVLILPASKLAGARQIPAATGGPAGAAEALISRAFQASYNLDYADGIALARQAVALNPESSHTHRALASVLWLDMLFRRGAITVDHYMGSVTKSQGTLPPVPADVDAEFQRELGRATELAEALLKQRPKDLDAREDVGTAYALRASYVSSVKASTVAAYGPAKRAFQEEEEVLSRDPQRTAAAFVVGIYRYVVSTFALPTRFLAYVVGFGGGKEKGISLLETAAAGREAHVEASVALMLIYTKEGRHTDAMRVAQTLAAEFPRNRLFILEEGAAAVRAGLGAAGDAALTRGLAVLASDPRPRFPGELALWTYKRAMARTEMGHLADADTDLQAALAAGPVEWVRGRIHLQMGRVQDLRSHRPEAVAEYRLAKSTCESQNDPVCANEAGRLMKQPYRVGG